MRLFFRLTLGKRAAQHELSHDLKDRPPEFR
jgi:hypothetical protein